MFLITVGAAREQHSLAAAAGRSGALHARSQQRPQDLAPAHWPASHLSGPTGLHPTCLHPRCSQGCGLPCSLQKTSRLCFLCWNPKQDCGLEGMPPLPSGLLGQRQAGSCSAGTSSPVHSPRAGTGPTGWHLGWVCLPSRFRGSTGMRALQSFVRHPVALIVVINCPPC